MNRFPFPPYRSGIPHWSERVVTYCAKVLPIVFDNSLSYYEFLGHMQVKLNQVIEALNNQNLVFVEFTHMIELELQNFEKYMDERQSNFEQSMQDEWTAFKADMEEAWAAFKTQMEEAWAAEQELNARFRTDMQAAFTQFQTTIQERQTAFETSLRNQQNQFQTDMTSRQNTFEDTMEDNFEQWKVDTLAALQAGIQQFETNTLAAIRAELPAMILDAVDDEAIEPMVQAEVTRQGFAKILSASNETEGDAINLNNEYIKHFVGGNIYTNDIQFRYFNRTLAPYSSIIFTSQTLWAKVGKIRAVVTSSDLPQSGWKLQIGKYTTRSAISSEFNEANFTELVSSPMSYNPTETYYANSNAGVDAGRGYYQYVCIRYVPSNPQQIPSPWLPTNFSQMIEMFQGDTADLVLQSETNGNKYLIPKSAIVDQTFDPTSNNAQSGTALQTAINSQKYTLPTLTITPTVISSLPFVAPSGNNAYINTLAFHVQTQLPPSIPMGYYIGISTYGPIEISITSSNLIARGVITTYTGSQLTVGNSETFTIAGMHIFKVS